MKIVLCGSTAIDRIMTFQGRFKDLIKPEKLHVLSLSIILDQLRNTPGGTGANIAYSLALLGEKPVLFSSVGSDAKEYMAKLETLGVDTSQVHVSELATASFSVMTDLDDCQIGGFYPGALEDCDDLSLNRFVGEDIFVVVSSTSPAQMRKNVAECAEQKLRLFYDVSQQANNLDGDELRTGIAAAELLIVNDYELTVLAQKTGWSESEIQKKVKVCVVTLGAKGSVIFENGNKRTQVKAAHVETVIDPTGAGDAYRSGFMYGYVRGWDLEICAQLGSTVAVYAIEKMGTQEHIFTPAELRARYAANYDINSLPTFSSQ